MTFRDVFWGGLPVSFDGGFLMNHGYAIPVPADVGSLFGDALRDQFRDAFFGHGFVVVQDFHPTVNFEQFLRA